MADHCGQDGQHTPNQPGPDGVLRCACGAVSRHPAPPKEIR